MVSDKVVDNVVDDTKESNTSKYAFIGIGAVVVIGGTYFYFKTRKKH